MLSFDLHLPDLRCPAWRWVGDRWTCGRSWVRPFQHPVIETAIVSGPGEAGTCFVVRERRPGQPAVPSHAAQAIVSAPRWAGDHVVLAAQPGRVRVAAGPFGTVPVYLAAHSGSLSGSWHLPDLRHRIDIGRLCDRAVARTLTRQHRYSSDTLFADVHQLTERATATFTGGRWEVSYPPAASHVLRARSLRPGIDPVGALDNILGYIAGGLAAPEGQVGVELSGGADSANVALTVAALPGSGNVRSYGLTLDARQQHRRATITHVLGLGDTALDAYAHPPFSPDGARRRGRPHDPRGAYYQEAFDALRAAAERDGITVMFTGLGGDEANAPHPGEAGAPSPSPAPVPPPSWLGRAAIEALADLNHNLAPVSPVAIPTLLAFALHNPAYLNAGIWPTAPFAHPLVSRFLKQLPMCWRHRKALLRERIRRAGLGEEVADPPRSESFGALMDVGLRQYGVGLLKATVAESLLVDAGYIDGNNLRRAVTHAQDTGRLPSGLCDVLALETGLRSLAP